MRTPSTGRRAWIRGVLRRSPTRDPCAQVESECDGWRTTVDAPAQPFARRACARERAIAARASTSADALSARPVRPPRRADAQARAAAVAGAERRRRRSARGDRTSARAIAPAGATAAGARAVAMLPGIDGHLLSGAFIEQQLPCERRDRRIGRTRTPRSDRLAGRCATLGPASTPRTLLQSAAPLFAALGFEPPARSRPAEPGLAATLRSGRSHGRAAGHAVGRAARSALAARRHAGGAARRAVVPGLQRPALADRRRQPALRAAPSRVRSRSGASTTRDAFAALWQRLRRSGARRRPQTTAIAARAGRRVRSPCGRRLPIAARRRARRVGRRPARAHRDQIRPKPRHRRPRSVSLPDRRRRGQLRAGADHRLSHAVPAVRRSARARAAVAPDLSRELQPRGAARRGRAVAARRRALGRAARDRAPRARRLPRRRSARHAVQRPAVRAGAHAARRAARSGRRGGAAGDPGAVHAAGARSRGPRAHRLSRPRRRAARRRLRDAARLRAARSNADACRCEPGSGVRKATGTFYTPQPIADYLVRRTLGPLVRDATPEQILQLRIVDPAMGSGAFLVAACRYLADAYEAALVRAGGCHASDIGEAERVAHPADDRRALPVRRGSQSDGGAARAAVAVAGHARRGSAAQLSRSSAAGRRQPARRVARASAAAAAPSPAARPPSGTLPLFGDDACRDALRDALPVRFSLEAMPNDTLEQVRAKERAFAALTGARRGAVAVEADRGPLVRGVVRAGRDGAAGVGVRIAVGCHPDRPRRAAAADRGPLSRRRPTPSARRGGSFTGSSSSRKCSSIATAPAWPDAGFDAVIGNPPWDMIRADSGAADAPLARAARHGAASSASRATPASTPRSRTATRTAISCSSSARSR